MSTIRPSASFGKPAIAVATGARPAEQDERDHQQDQSGDGRAAHLLGWGGPPGQGGHDGDLGDGPGRQPRREDGGHHGQQQRQADHPPRQGEHADQVVRALLQRGPVGQPAGQPEHQAEDRAGDADDGAVGQHHEADVPVGGARRGEHAEGPQPALRQHGEAADRDQGDEQHPDDQAGDGDRLGVDHVGLRLRSGGRDVMGDRGGRPAGPVEQHGDLGRVMDLAGRHEGELVQQALRVLHDAHDGPCGAALVPHAADPEAEVGRHPAGHRYLACPRWEVPGDQGEHRLPVRAVRVLRT